MTMAQHDVRSVLEQFPLAGEFVQAAPYGHGHINDTYAAEFRGDNGMTRYILQRVNHTIFKDVPRLMENIQRVTEHLRGKFAAWPGHAPDQETLTIIPTRDGKNHHRDAQGNFWRVYVFLEGAHTVELVESPAQACEAAKAFGRFQRLLADLPAPRLHDTIPDFHHTVKRFQALERAIEKDVRNRAAKAREQLEFAGARKGMAGVLLEPLAAGRLPERITHNDTKINNVMLRDRDGSGSAVIDLDTVMPGLVLYDFGDQVRTSTCTGTEDEQDLAKVVFRLELFDALVCGYMEEARGFLTPVEMDHLVVSGPLITFEIGIRFLTDYLEGDVYFKTRSAEHNLERARTQFARVRAMEQARAEMDACVRRHR
jgi:hypothetical protein